jgi:hypothetical protein
MEQKPHWMTDHEASDERRFTSIDAALKRIEDKLDPVSEAYSTASTLGKWLMGAAVFISVLLGIVMSVRTIFNK